MAKQWQQPPTQKRGAGVAARPDSTAFGATVDDGFVTGTKGGQGRRCAAPWVGSVFACGWTLPYDGGEPCSAMKRRSFLLAQLSSVLALSLLAAPGEPAPRELLRDRDWRAGLVVLAAKGAGREAGRVRPPQAPPAPVWQLAQWHSRFEFADFTPPSASFGVTNAAKWLRLEHDPAVGPVLTLGVDTRPEYEGRLRQTASEPWVHLLVQQTILDAPALAETPEVRLRFATRLAETQTFRPAGYTPARHAAQYQVVLTLNNTRAGSPGFGDFLWFVVPVYDDRFEVPPPHIAQDFAVTQGKLVYNPGAAAFASCVSRAGDWTQFDADLRPWLERALQTAWEKGYLPHSRALADYRLAHLNVGWEVPGLNRVAMDLRGLSLTVPALQAASERREAVARRSPE